MIVETIEKMSSLEIAELTGKSHSHLMRDIRKMEAAWIKVGQSKFGLVSYKDQWNREQPMYELTKSECLYIATKFNDEARAQLVLRWQELEKEKAPKSQAEIILQSAQLLVDHENRLTALEQKIEYKSQDQRFLEIENARMWQKEDQNDLYNSRK